jgi:hypothetical protein
LTSNDDKCFFAENTPSLLHFIDGDNEIESDKFTIFHRWLADNGTHIPKLELKVCNTQILSWKNSSS